MAEFILSEIQDREEIDKAIFQAARATEEIVTNGIDSAMNKYNK